MEEKQKQVKQKKKSYNPFKMSGPWIGFTFILGMIYGRRDTYVFDLNYYSFNEILIFSFVILLIGFLFGWGVHSLLRRYQDE